MPYNTAIDLDLSRGLSGWNTTRKKMFGGTCYLLDGNMLCGVYKDYLILRLGPGQAQKALSKPHVKPFDITGRPMKGWIMVTEDGCKTDKDLKTWLDQAKNFVKTLPTK
jgi:TfoX/Sxy family transcriptional regulator of competence genes